MTSDTPWPQGARALLAGALDYAGTFPPAALDLPTAVANYARYGSGPMSWMLGRFVIAAGQLDEFEQVSARVLPRGAHAEPWHITVTAVRDLLGDVTKVEKFNARHGRNSGIGRAVIDYMEHRIGRSKDVRLIDETVPVPVRSAFEIIPGAPLDDILRFVKQVDGTAKIRLGGPTPDMIPSVGDVAEFIVACARGKVTMKATGGLHHAVRGEYTLGTDRQRALQHGFLNVLVAAILARARVTEGSPTKDVLMLAESVLDERDPSAFVLDDAGVSWWDSHLSVGVVTQTREFFASFGSCSFDEPVAELQAIGLTV